jgi:hypothetical protein
LLEQDQAFFDGFLGDDVVDHHRAVLADAVRAVGRLILDGRIPPGIHQEDVIGSGEIQARPASLQGDQEDRRSVVASKRDARTIGGRPSSRA